MEVEAVKTAVECTAMGWPEAIAKSAFYLAVAWVIGKVFG